MQRSIFTDWQSYDVDRRVALRATVGPVTEMHRMPLWYYVTLHPDARLTPREYEILREWSQQAAEEREPK